MFIGEYQHTLDTKGRMFVPSKFREELGDVFYVMPGMERCLFVYTAEEFHRLQSKCDAAPLTSRDAREFNRAFFSGAFDCEMDKQGRIMIPQKLRDFARLSKDITVVGVSNRVEIWDTNKWEETHSLDHLDLDELAEKMEQYL